MPALREANLAALVADAAATAGGRTALGADEAELSYAMLDEGSARVAGLLGGRGVLPGDRVGLMLPNVPEFATVYYGVLRAGGVVVPVSPRLPLPDVAQCLEEARARLVFAWHAFAEAAEQGAQRAGAACVFVMPSEFERLLASADPAWDLAVRQPSDTAAIVYTPTASGRSQGRELAHSDLAARAAAVVETHGLGPEDVVLVALPLYRGWTQTCALNATLGAGARLEVARAFDAVSALQTIERAGVTSFVGVPAMFKALVEDRERVGADVSTLRVCRSRRELRPSVRRAFEAAFGCVVIEDPGRLA